MTEKCKHFEELQFYLGLSGAIPGWTRGEEAWELLCVSHGLPANANLVEIGSFVGAGAILLAGARKVCGSGLVHCVDPFDCSGDSFSVPHYQRILTDVGGGSLRDHFDRNIRDAGLEPWIRIHQGDAAEVARDWTTLIDLLYLDGDQSRPGARQAYEEWAPFIKVGGVIALHNSAPGNHTAHHDGNRCIVEEEIRPPCYDNIRLVGSTTFATKS